MKTLLALLLTVSFIPTTLRAQTGEETALAYANSLIELVQTTERKRSSYFRELCHLLAQTGDISMLGEELMRGADADFSDLPEFKDEGDFRFTKHVTKERLMGYAVAFMLVKSDFFEDILNIKDWDPHIVDIKQRRWSKPHRHIHDVVEFKLRRHEKSDPGRMYVFNGKIRKLETIAAGSFVSVFFEAGRTLQNWTRSHDQYEHRNLRLFNAMEAYIDSWFPEELAINGCSL